MFKHEILTAIEHIKLNITHVEMDIQVKTAYVNMIHLEQIKKDVEALINAYKN